MSDRKISDAEDQHELADDRHRDAALRVDHRREAETHGHRDRLPADHERVEDELHDKADGGADQHCLRDGEKERRGRTIASGGAGATMRREQDRRASATMTRVRPGTTAAPKIGATITTPAIRKNGQT